MKQKLYQSPVKKYEYKSKVQGTTSDVGLGKYGLGGPKTPTSDLMEFWFAHNNDLICSRCSVTDSTR